MPPFNAYEQGPILGEVEDPYYPTTVDVVKKPPSQNDLKKVVKKETRSISFNPVVKVIKTLHFRDYTTEEISACWYNESEVRAIRDDAKFAAELVKNRQLEQDTEMYCRRGVECKAKANKSRRRKLKMAAWFAVLEEQKSQLSQEGVTVADPMAISHAYQVAASTQAAATAVAVALKDELDALMWKKLRRQKPPFWSLAKAKRRQIMLFFENRYFVDIQQKKQNKK